MTTKRLIEEWLPIAALGEESVRERRSMTALPPVYYLHVWWARRPLVAARAAVLASLLPADADQEHFVHLLGIHGDPVASRRRIEQARRVGQRFEGDAYSYPRAFTYVPSEKERGWIQNEQTRIGIDLPTVLDCTAGGGSIPFESVRLGFRTLANDLNPVATLILRATVEFPARLGLAASWKYEALAADFIGRRERRLAAFFPSEADSGSVATNYFWARAIHCPYCNGLIPLSPTWKLAPNGTGVRLQPQIGTRRCMFEIVSTVDEQSPGTVLKGDAQCPFSDCGRVTPVDAIKSIATTGGMGEQLFAVAIKQLVGRTRNGKPKWARGYRAAQPSDDVAGLVAEYHHEKSAEWDALNLVPTEALPMDTESWTHGNTPAQYGARYFRDLFSPRQLLAHAVSVEIYHELLMEWRLKGELDDAAKAAFTYLALALDKLRDYNSLMTRWHNKREVTVNTFDSHDFASTWSYSEMVPLLRGIDYDWAIEQAGKCIKELVALVRPDSSGKASKGQSTLALGQPLAPPTIFVTNGSGDNLGHVEDGTVDAIVMDPPYYDNVMYAELSDFFYVWLKRTVGHVFPEYFKRKLTDKENEAVANVAKFGRKPGAKVAAAKDYQQRMASIFTECRRKLKSDGILTVMFTHKAKGAWDALASSLIEAGFTVTASWPVNTEPEGALGIKDKAAANSTIFLVCRPRPLRQDDEPSYWEDIEPLVAAAVRKRIGEFEEAGIRGVDQYLACFGPALEEFAQHWPLRRGQPKVTQNKKGRERTTDAEDADPYAVTPEDALEAARREVKKWRLDRLLRATRHADMDPMTEWFVLAWDAFKAPEFPFDEALRLARVVGVDLDKDIVGKLGEKKGSDILLWDSVKRAAKGALGPTDGSRALIDALHHAAHRGRTAGLEAARELLETSRADQLPSFTAALTAVLEVLPVSSTFTKAAEDSGPVAEAAADFDVLEHLRRLAYSDRVKEPEQLLLWKEGT